MKLEEKHSQTDLYQILQVENDADLATIKEKYLQLALLYHPDKPTGDLQKFKDVCLAYKVLSNKKRRTEYDATLAATVDELRDKEARDVEYHQTEQFTKLNEEGERVFDEDSFKQDFEVNRTVQEKEEMERLNKEMEEKQTAAPKSLEEILAERDRDLTAIHETQAAMLNPQNFDPSIFNQMFNDMKSRKQELSPVEEVREGEGFTGEVGEPAGLPASMGGGDGLGSGFGGGLSGIGAGMVDGSLQFGSTPFGQVSANEHQGMFEQPAPEVLDEIRQKASEYKSDPSLVYVKDQLHNEEDKKAYYDEMEDKFAQMKADFEKNAYMDKDQYIVKPGMLDNPLGDPELFQTQILGLDAVKRSVEDSVTEVTENQAPEATQITMPTQNVEAPVRSFLAPGHHYGVRYVNGNLVPINSVEEQPQVQEQQSTENQGNQHWIEKY